MKKFDMDLACGHDRFRADGLEMGCEECRRHFFDVVVPNREILARIEAKWRATPSEWRAFLGGNEE